MTVDLTVTDSAESPAESPEVQMVSSDEAPANKEPEHVIKSDESDIQILSSDESTQ